MTSKTALITGVTGMDGSYLSEFLLSKNYIVHGIIRRGSTNNTLERIKHILDNENFHLHYGDLTDSSSLFSIIATTKPDELYNLAALSHVAISFDNPVYTADVDGLGVTRLLEACKQLNKNIKIYQAGTSELYGGVYKDIQDEKTPFQPQSPYSIAKLYAYWMVKNYRQSYDMFIVNGILFNHTSPRRGANFVEQKIVKAAVAIKLGLQEYLRLGNIYSYRDFGHSKDFVKAMWLMLQNEKPKDYVISSGEKHKIKDIVNKVFDFVGMNLEWFGEGVNEVAKCNGKTIVKIDEKLFRPSEVDNLIGDSSIARKELKWKPEYSFDDILCEMIEEELKFKECENCI